MGILKVIEWIDNSRNTIVHKVDFKSNVINKGSMLIVREGQVAIFSDKGKMADVFLPGTYKLDTNSLPIITKLLSWKYGFETPYKSDVYFVRTTQFVDQKWGTNNPIIMRDADYGQIRVRGYGSWSFRVDDAFVLMQELSGNGSSYRTDDIVNYLKSLIVTDLTTALGQLKVPVLDLASNLGQLSTIAKDAVQPTFKNMGLILVNFNVENFNLPKELEETLDKSTSMNMMRGNIDVYTQMAAADAMKEAAKNPGMAGGTMGAGMGIGMGVGLGQIFSNTLNGAMNNNPNQSQQNTNNNQPNNNQLQDKCVNCNAVLKPNSKFCGDCGQPTGKICPKCNAVSAFNAKFCGDCGTSFILKCANCGKELLPNAKFCSDCGTSV